MFLTLTNTLKLINSAIVTIPSERKEILQPLIDYIQDRKSVV
mgnify:CR=1 FL=1